MMTDEYILYKLSDNKAKSYGYSEMYVFGKYEITDNGFIKVSEVVDLYDENRIIAHPDKSEFEGLEGQPIGEGKKLFKKYGIDVDIVSVFNAKKGNQKILYAVVGGKL